MTDDPGTDSPAEDPRIEALSRASRSIHVAPLDAVRFVRAARVRRRRRRTIISSVLAAAVIVTGVSVATAGTSPTRGTEVDVADQPDAPAAETKDLTVNVQYLYPRTPGFEIQAGTTRWDPETQTLVYVTSTFYGGCLAEGAAILTGATVSLVLAAPSPEQLCKGQTKAAIVTISGLTDAPNELIVTEDGETRPVAVTNPRADEAILTATPSTLMPGAEFVVDTTGERGVGFTLTAEDGTTYYLNAQDLGGTPSWSNKPGFTSAIALLGPGVAIVPPIASPGTYELCTANTAERQCTSIQVEEAMSDTVTVPNVITLPVPEAKRILEEAGFAVVVVQDRECPESALCVLGVFSTTPEPNSEIAPGAEITIEAWR